MIVVPTLWIKILSPCYGSCHETWRLEHRSWRSECLALQWRQPCLISEGFGSISGSQTLGRSSDGSNNRVSATHMGVLDWVPSFWLWAVNQLMAIKFKNKNKTKLKTMDLLTASLPLYAVSLLSLTKKKKINFFSTTSPYSRRKLYT